MIRVKFCIVLSWSMMVNSMGFLHFSISYENSAYRAGRILVQGTLNLGVFSREIQRNLSEKTILSCSLTPRKIIPHVVIATLLKRQNAIIPKRIRHERDPFFFTQKVRSSVKMPLANSFSHLYSKSAFLLSLGEIRINLSPKCVLNRFPDRSGARWTLWTM